MSIPVIFKLRHYPHREACGVDDGARADRILCGIIGKRLTYQTTAARA